MISYKAENGKTLWYYTFVWTDDYHYNMGFDNINGDFIGSMDEFHEWAKAEEEGQGFVYGNLKKRHASMTEKRAYDDLLGL